MVVVDVGEEEDEESGEERVARSHDLEKEREWEVSPVQTEGIEEDSLDV